MPISAREFIKNSRRLAPMPEVCLRVNEMAQDPKYSALDLANEISHDVALAAHVLKLANSAYYNFPARIDTLTRAVMVIGTQDLSSMVLALGAIAAFPEKFIARINVEQFWRHSIYTGLLARRLGGICSTPVLHRERLFVAGVLHDIGQLVMFEQIPELTAVMYRYAQHSDVPFHLAERIVFGLSHDQIGAELAKIWNLPESLQAILRYQFEPEKAGKYALEASVVLIANAYAINSGLPGIAVDNTIEIDDFAWSVTGLDNERVMSVISTTNDEYQEVIGTFMEKKAVNA